MIYKGFKVEKAESPFHGKFYFISKDNEQYWPCDGECPSSIVQCKKLINNYIKKHS